MNDADERFARTVARDFREAADDLDPVTAARLAAARRRAVAAGERPRLAPWVPALAATAAGILVVAVLWRPASGPAVVAPEAADAEAMEMLMNEPDEMFQEDPDFYLWLDVVAVEG